MKKVYEVEFQITGKTEVTADSRDHAEDVFNDMSNADFADAGDVHIVGIETVENYEE